MTYVFVFLAGALFALLLTNLKQKKKAKGFERLFEPYLTGETWFATGDNAEVFHGPSGTRYIEAQFARSMRGLGMLMGDPDVIVHIPNVGSPRYNEAFTLRMRRPTDPSPPHYQTIGSYLYAESQGWTQAR